MSDGAFRVAVLPGDGIGPEVTAEAVKCLEAVAEVHGLTCATTQFPHGAEHYLASGEVMSDESFAAISGHDAILFGATGDPRVPGRMLGRGILFRLVRDLGLDLSIRPVRLYAPSLSPLRSTEDGRVDLVLVREAAQDVSAVPGGTVSAGSPDEVSVGQIVFSRRIVEKTIRHAFELARRRGRQRRVSLCDHANIAEVYDIWGRVAEEVAAEYPDVELESAAPDAVAMQLVKNPAHFDVIVTSMVFGGIFADLAAVLAGGVGLAGSVRLNPGSVSLFEPIHGSAPKYAGKDVVSPVGAIASVVLLLRHVGHEDAAAALDRAIEQAFVRRAIPSAASNSGIGTRRQGDVIAALVREGV
ncbi:isocitrate/isopropylmalate dehydrogenase family protein [Blastococcus sp. SYSU DS0616]